MLSCSAISDVNDQLAVMDAKYTGSAISEARRKPMPPSLMRRVA